MKISVSCPSQIEAVTKRELKNLINVDAPSLNGIITFDGDIKTVAKLNLRLRTASRVYINLGSFKCSSFDELFDNLVTIPFEEYITKDGKILINVTLVESKLTANSATCSVSKKAIFERLTKKYKTALTQTGEEYSIFISIHRNYASVYLDTSGTGLHKRGYRKDYFEAPLKENVASAILDLTYFNENKPLADLFTGSGTIPIEATMKALNIPCGLNRDFAFLHFKSLDTSFYKDLVEEEKSKIKWNTELDIVAYDIDSSAINLAKQHAKLAGVDKYIRFENKDMREFTSNKSYGVIVSNPPYGERLLERKDVVKLYRDFAKVYNSLDNWSLYALTDVSDFERLFNRKADKKRKIYNGKLECTLYSILGAKPPKNSNIF